MDRQNTDPGLIAVCVAITLCTMAYWFTGTVTAKDEQIKALESQVSNLQGQLTGYSQGRH